MLYNLSIKILIILKIFTISISIELEQIKIVIFVLLIDILRKKNNKTKIYFCSLSLLFIKEIFIFCFEKDLLFFALFRKRIYANLLEQLILILLLNRLTSL